MTAESNRLVILNAISTSMTPEGGEFYVTPITLDDAKKIVNEYRTKGEIKCYVGHEATIRLLEVLLETPLACVREAFTAPAGMITPALVVNVGTRLPEGKTLTFVELYQMYQEGKVRFYFVVIRPWLQPKLRAPAAP